MLRIVEVGLGVGGLFFPQNEKTPPNPTKEGNIRAFQKNTWVPYSMSNKIIFPGDFGSDVLESVQKPQKPHDSLPPERPETVPNSRIPNVGTPGVPNKVDHRTVLQGYRH